MAISYQDHSMVSAIARPGENSSILLGYSHFGGKHGDTATLRNILAQVGVTAPHSGQVYIDDRAASPLTVTIQELEVARARVASYKHRVMIVGAPKHAPDLRAAIEEGIRDCCQGLLAARISNFSLKALSKWAGLVANPRDKKGWPNVFPPGRDLYKALMGVLHAVELNGTGGGAFRSMYADF